MPIKIMFPSPYGAWVSSFMLIWTSAAMGFRPLTGHGFHQQDTLKYNKEFLFPSPYGAWVSS